MASAVNQRFECYATADKQGADALGCVKFVAGDCQKIDPEFIDACWNLANGLRGVGVKQNIVVVCDPGAIFDRLDGADLIVGVHDADKDRAGCNGSAEIVRVKSTCAIDRQIGHVGTKVLKESARLDNRRVLDLGRDDVVTLVAVSKKHALKSKVICLAAAARKNNLVILATEERCYLTARRLNGRRRRTCSPMSA